MDHNSSNVVYKRTNTASLPFEPIENLSKKRPSQTKLDIQKMYEDSLRLAAQYKELMMQNQQLKEQYQRVETIKHNRQNLIAAVQNIVEQKSKEINSKHANNFSWLVFKLNNKIYDLKAKIAAKEKAITEVLMSRESDIIRQKHTDIQCLNEIVDFAKREGLVCQTVGHRDTAELSEIKEIVWMEQEIKEKEAEIIEAEKEYQQEQKEVRRLMQALAKKKAELKSIKQMEVEHQRAQQLYKEEKKRKEQRIAGNKTYMQELQNQKIEQQKKLETLKTKYKIMEEEENRAIANLEQQLQKLKADYQERLKLKQDTVIKFNEEKPPVKNKNKVKRVTHNQVKLIGGNLNYSLALRGVSHLEIPNYFPDYKEQYSIGQVTEILKKYPFCMQDQSQALLLARYTIQDAGDGYFLQDMDTSQSVSVIRSILTKLIGDVKVYQRQKAEKMRQEVGPIVFKFGRLVQQALQLEEGKNQRQGGGGKNKLVSKQRMVDALESTISSLHSQLFMHDQVQFTIFYLFSWSKDLSKLELRRLYKMVEEDINWPSKQ